MNNSRPGIEPATTGARGGGLRHRLATWSPRCLGERWRLPTAALVGGARLLAAVITLGLFGGTHVSWASAVADYDVMYVLVGVSPNPPDPTRRLLTYRAERLTQGQKDWLESTSGLLRVWQRYARTPGGAATKVFYTDPMLDGEATVTVWNKGISGERHPAPGAIVTKVSQWPYEDAGRFGVESCVGMAPGDDYGTQFLWVMPGTACPQTPPSNVSCDLRVTDVIDLGSLAPGQPGRGNGMITAECQGTREVYLSLGPVYLTNDDSNLVGLVGDHACQGLRPTLDLMVAGGSAASQCLHIEGSFPSTGVKRIPGVVVASFK